MLRHHFEKVIQKLTQYFHFIFHSIFCKNFFNLSAFHSLFPSVFLFKTFSFYYFQPFLLVSLYYRLLFGYLSGLRIRFPLYSHGFFQIRINQVVDPDRILNPTLFQGIQFYKMSLQYLSLRLFFYQPLYLYFSFSLCLCVSMS